MKKDKVKRAVLGDKRTIKKFVLCQTLRLPDGYEQTRYLELADITQNHDGEKWVDLCWSQ